MSLNTQVKSNMVFALTLFFCMILVSNSVQALEINAGTMIQNISQAIPNLMRLVTALSYVLGMSLVVKGVLELKQYGEQRTMMSSQHSLKGPIIFLVAGTILLYLPSSVWVSLSTFWTNPNPYAYVQEGNDPWWQTIKAVLMIIELVGVIAFIRGVMILTQLAGHSGQPGTFARAMAHMVGGVFCINMYQFVQTVRATLGL